MWNIFIFIFIKNKHLNALKELVCHGKKRTLLGTKSARGMEGVS